MTNVLDVMKFDDDLSVGDTVEVRWTSSGYAFKGAGTVAKLNACSARVALSEPVAPDFHGGWPAGREISVPRCTFRSIERWTWNNGVFPVAS